MLSNKFVLAIQRHAGSPCTGFRAAGTKAGRAQLPGWRLRGGLELDERFGGKPIASAGFQMCATRLIASVRRIKLPFHAIPLTQLCISEEGKFVAKGANGAQFARTKSGDEQSLKGVTRGKNTNIPARILAFALQTLQP